MRQEERTDRIDGDAMVCHLLSDVLICDSVVYDYGIRTGGEDVAVAAASRRNHKVMHTRMNILQPRLPLQFMALVRNNSL